MSEIGKWEEVHNWKRSTSTFTVEIQHHNIGYEDSVDRGNRWAVYAYIYPNHPLFKTFSGWDMFQEAACKLPLHAGPSYIRWHMDKENKPCSIQVGADYNHSGDDKFSYYDAGDVPREVCKDAEQLYQHLLTTGKEVA